MPETIAHYFFSLTLLKRPAVHLVDEEIAFMMAAEADNGLPSFEPKEPAVEPSDYDSQPSSLRI